jgi:hypothetical protein
MAAWLVALMHRGESQASVYIPSIDVHRASAALAVIASYFRSDPLARGFDESAAILRTTQ